MPGPAHLHVALDHDAGPERDVAVDLQPAGWRLTDAPGRDARLARSLFRSDLDMLEEVAQGYAGPVKISVGGPWTAVAMMERPRGDRVLADSGARRDVAQSLADGLGELVAELARRLVEVVRMVRELDLKKPPSLAESIDWARTLLLLGADDIDRETFERSMSIIVKHRTDIDLVAERVGVKLATRAP